MSIKKLFTIFMLFAFLPMASFAAEAPSIKGVYKRVPGQQYRYDGKTVEVVEFLSFYCGSCYNFEKSVPIIKGNFPKKIKWKIMPIYWGNGSSKPGEAYFLAEEAGKGEDMKKALFQANFVDKKDIGKVEVLESIAGELGLGFDFSRRLRTGEKAGEARKAIDMARAYGVDETPAVVIAGNLMTSPGPSHNTDGFRENVLTILKSILNR